MSSLMSFEIKFKMFDKVYMCPSITQFQSAFLGLTFMVHPPVPVVFFLFPFSISCFMVSLYCFLFTLQNLLANADVHFQTQVKCYFSTKDYSIYDSRLGFHWICFCSSLYLSIIFFTAKDGEALYSQQKQDQSGSDHELLIATRSFRYDLNHITYDYTVEVRNRFKGLDLIDREPDDLWMEVHDIVQETEIKTIPKKKTCKRQNG